MVALPRSTVLLSPKTLLSNPRLKRRDRRRGSGAGTGRRIGGGGRENAEQKKGCDFPHVDHAAASDSRAFRLATAAATLPANERRSVMPSVKSVGPSTR